MLFRKSAIKLLAFLLLALPFMGIWAEDSHAATSRVAVIKSLSGIVQVKKAGGSKQFKAFAKMSLNEGDVLTTAANSTAMLQFANGTSEDDKMTVSANTTLTFSKLSDRKGTRTKVSMFNGTAWVDVKSIASKEDEFTLETPTAVMGVRGTHLLVSVDPVSGATKLTVAAGVVNTQPTGDEISLDVKPGDNALITKDEDESGDITIAPVDLELLISQSDKSIVEAIVAASGQIVKENEEKLEQYFEGSGAGSPDDLTRQKTNVENLLGAIVDTAIKSGLISAERVNQLVAEAQAQTGITIDLNKKSITLTEEQKNQAAVQKRKEEEAKRLAEEKKKAAEEERKKNEALNRKLEEERKQREEEKRKSEDEKKKKAEEAYEKQLAESEKERYLKAKNDRAAESNSNVSPSPSGKAGSTPGSDSSSGGNPGSQPVALALQNLTLHQHIYDEDEDAYVWSQLDQFQFSPGNDDFDAFEVSVQTNILYLKPSVAAGLHVSASNGDAHYDQLYEGMIIVPLGIGMNNITVSVYNQPATSSTSVFDDVYQSPIELPAVHKDYILKVERRSVPDKLNSWSVFKSDNTGGPLPSGAIEPSYKYRSEFFFQTESVLDALTFDIHYDANSYPELTTEFDFLLGETPAETPDIVTVDSGHSKMVLKNLQQGIGLFKLKAGSKTLFTFYLLNGVSAPDWENIGLPVYLRDLSVSEMTYLQPEPTGASSSFTVTDFYGNGKINVIPMYPYGFAMSGPVGTIEHPSSSNGFKNYIVRPTGAAESTVTVWAFDESLYFSHVYTLKIIWEAQESFEISYPSEDGEAKLELASTGDQSYFGSFPGFLEGTIRMKLAFDSAEYDSAILMNVSSENYQVAEWDAEGERTFNAQPGVNEYLLQFCKGENCTYDNKSILLYNLDSLEGLPGIMEWGFYSNGDPENYHSICEVTDVDGRYFAELSDESQDTLFLALNPLVESVKLFRGETLVIPEMDGNAYHEVDISDILQSGTNRLRVEIKTDGETFERELIVNKGEPTSGSVVSSVYLYGHEGDIEIVEGSTFDDVTLDGFPDEIKFSLNGDFDSTDIVVKLDIGDGNYDVLDPNSDVYTIFRSEYSFEFYDLIFEVKDPSHQHTLDTYYWTVQYPYEA